MSGKKHACEYFNEKETDIDGRPMRVGPFPAEMWTITLFQEVDGEPVRYRILAGGIDNALLKGREVFGEGLRIKSMEHEDIYR